MTVTAEPITHEATVEELLTKISNSLQVIIAQNNEAFGLEITEESLIEEGEM